MPKQNKITVFILVLIILPSLGYLYLAKGLNIDGFLNYLKIPAIIIGGLLAILLNIPKVQKWMEKSNGNIAQKRTLFLDQDETEIYSGRNTVFSLVLGFIPTFYFFSNVIVTDKRIKFTLFPFLSMPSWSIFYKETETSFPYTPHIVGLIKNKSSLRIITSDQESIWIFFKDQETLVRIESETLKQTNMTTI